ncbi:hypothetical protein [Deinococcus phoenicis]|uniref:hypothetical protein n=1 Tax=Deinococcus phoenicis TaxID=1476583 RepID=UPI000556BED5|nr:hypothetical protein [Deinococcus phoenicis]
MPSRRPVLPVRLLAALLTILAGFAYPLRTLPVGVFPQSHAHHHAPHGKPATPTEGGHGPHCLFCLTGAFSADPTPGPSLPVRVGRLPPAPAPVPRAAHVFALHPDARAPPPLA